MDTFKIPCWRGCLSRRIWACDCTLFSMHRVSLFTLVNMHDMGDEGMYVV